MDIIYNTWGRFNGYSINTENDISLVLEYPTQDQKLMDWIVSSKLGTRLSSIHYIYPEKLEDKKTVPIHLLKKGFERIKTEIITTIPNIKRILYLGTNISFLFPKLNKSLSDIHGTIFDISIGTKNIQFIPSFIKINKINKDYFNQDIKRTLYLNKPKSPLKNDLNYLPESIEGTLVVDLETTGLNPWIDKITTIGLQWNDQERSLITEDIPEWIEYLSNLKNVQFYFHNSYFDVGFLGKKFRDNQFDNIHCTMLRSKSSGEITNSLKHLGNLYTDNPGNYSWIKSDQDFEFDDPCYVNEDLDVTYKLSKKYEYLNDSPIIKLMEPCAVMCADQSDYGSKIDLDFLENIHIHAQETVKRLEKELFDKYGVNPSEKDKLVQVLIERGYTFYKTTEKGNISLDEKVLKELGLDDIIEYRKISKIDSTYISKVKKMIRPDGTVSHSQIVLGAISGRSVMKNSLWQTAPKQGPVRNLLISRFDNGFILNVDLSAAELFVAAYLSEDQDFINILKLPDPHSFIASMAFNIPLDQICPEERNASKTIIFGLIYGKTKMTEEHKRVFDYLNKSFPKFMNWIKNNQKQAIKDCFIKTHYGKIQNLIEILEWKGEHAVGRSGGNGKVQGTANELSFEISLYIYRKFKELKLKSLVLFGVHDSTMVDLHPDEVNIVISIIQDSFRNLHNTHAGLLKKLKELPLKGDLVYGKSWAKIEKSNKEYYDPENIFKHQCSSELLIN